MSVGGVLNRTRAERDELGEEVPRADATAAPTSRVPQPVVGLASLRSTEVLIADAIATAARLQSSAVPVGLADLSLYTDDALDREIAALRSRTEGRRGTAADAEREILGRLEAEQLRRATPRMVPADTLSAKADLERVIATETTFLSRYGGRLPEPVRAEHTRYIEGLRSKLELLLADERVCGDARPTPAPPHLLPHGAHEASFDADDLIATLERQVPLSKQQEGQVRAAFERWRRTECWRTGHDPTRFARSGNYQEAQRDRADEAAEHVRMCLEMLEAMRSSALAAAAFLDSAARGDTVEGAHARVVAAKNLGEIAGALPVAPAKAHAPAPRAEAREVDGVAQKIVDEAIGRGHAQDTRFRGVDNSAYERNADRITYGPWRKNTGRRERTMAEACAIYERHTGRPIPSWVKFNPDKTVGNDRLAEYVFGRNQKGGDPFRIEQLESGVVVRLRPDVLESDEAIVAVLTHELYELEGLHEILSDGAGITKADVIRHTGSNRGENLHGKAWNMADVEVLLMRATPGTPEHARLLRARESILAQRGQ